MCGHLVGINLGFSLKKVIHYDGYLARGNMDYIGYKVIVSGIVQAVGFRYFTCMEARLHHVMGHAKNLQCGDVEVVMYGPREQIAKMLKWLETGPQTARVTGITISEIPYQKSNDFIAC
ncbi:MAG: acylphosphatase [Psychromonas sp.]